MSVFLRGGPYVKSICSHLTSPPSQGSQAASEFPMAGRSPWTLWGWGSFGKPDLDIALGSCWTFPPIKGGKGYKQEGRGKETTSCIMQATAESLFMPFLYLLTTWCVEIGYLYFYFLPCAFMHMHAEVILSVIGAVSCLHRESISELWHSNDSWFFPFLKSSARGGCGGRTACSM